MKWLDNIIKERVKKELSPIDIQINELQEKIKDNARLCCKDRDELRQYVDIREQLIRESFFNSEKALNLKIREAEVSSREDLELALKGLLRTIDKRLNDIGEKKGIVVDLLKKIAKLEGDNVP